MGMSINIRLYKTHEWGIATEFKGPGGDCQSNNLTNITFSLEGEKEPQVS